MDDASGETDRPVGVRAGTAAGRGVLIATVLGSGIAFLDALIVSVALPPIDRELGLGVTGLQWTVSGYLLTLSALLLLGGSLGDLYGRRRIYVVGLVSFAVTSVACGAAVSAPMLVAARLLQGAAAALMIPASLAVIQSSFVPEDRGRAIGTWVGLSSAFTAVGPFVGGAFVSYVSWRWAFFINVPLIAVAVWAAVRWVPDIPSGVARDGRPDVAGSVLATAGLGAVIYWGIENESGVASAIVGIAGVLLLTAFVYVERSASRPVMPLSLFRSRQFDWLNVCTVVFYGAFGSAITFLTVQLQVALGYTPLEAGMATVPVSVMLLLLAGRFGALGQRIGPRLPMTVGPALVAMALLLLSRTDAGDRYWTVVFPGVVLWGFGLSITVAPLTAAVLNAVDQRRTGLASAINNAASRVGQALGVALIPVAAGIGGNAALEGPEFVEGFGSVMAIAAGLCLGAAVIAWLFVSNERPAGEG